MKVEKPGAVFALFLLLPSYALAEETLPPCKDGGETCDLWDRDWPTKEDQEFAELFRTWKDLDERTPSYAQVWQFTGGDVDYSVTKADITNRNDGSRVVWVRGDHRRDKSVKYRSSVWRYVLDCGGYSTLTAYSTYAANGANLTSWDGYSKTVIRPNTLLSSLEYYLCK